MRNVAPSFRRKTERLQRVFNDGGEIEQIRRRFDSAPHNARTFLVGEEANTAETQRHEFDQSNLLQSCCDRRKFLIVSLAQKF